MEDDGGNWPCSMCGTELNKHPTSWWPPGMYRAFTWLCLDCSRLSSFRDAHVGPGLLHVAWQEHAAAAVGGGEGPALADGGGYSSCLVCRGDWAPEGTCHQAGGQGPELRPAGRDG